MSLSLNHYPDNKVSQVLIYRLSQNSTLSEEGWGVSKNECNEKRNEKYMEKKTKDKERDVEEKEAKMSHNVTGFHFHNLGLHVFVIFPPGSVKELWTEKNRITVKGRRERMSMKKPGKWRRALIKPAP